MLLNKRVAKALGIIKIVKKQTLFLVIIFNLSLIYTKAESDFYKFLISLNSKSIDSLLNVTTTGQTKNKIKAHNYLGAYFESISNYPLAIFHLNQANVLNKINDNEKIITQNFLGYIYWHKSNYDSALIYHQLALKKINKNNPVNNHLAFTYLMLGNDYYDLGDYSKTSKYFFNSLAIYEKLNDTIGLIQIHNRLSKLYYKLKDYAKAKNHISISQQFNKSVQYIRELAISYNSIGNIQIETGSLNSALYYFTKTHTEFKKCGDVIGQAIASINLGDTYQTLYERGTPRKSILDSSFKYYLQSYNLNKSVNNKFGMIYGVWGLSDIEMKNGNTKEAYTNYLNALQLSKSINAKSEIYNLYWKLHSFFELKGNKDSSYYYLKYYITAKNKLENEEQTKALLRQESKYEIDKRIAEQKEIIEREKLIATEKNKRKNYIIFGIVIVLIILIYAVINSIKKIKIINSKNETINIINAELTIQKKEITDSINYARTLQDAILPSEKYFNECNLNCFVFYKPKDIVAGDFYWLEKRNDLLFIAVADCTGHGVPGAMGSVLCSNALNRSLLEFGILDPGEILNKTRTLIVETFSKSEKDVKDGMDISLLSINMNTLEINWAGANNPLWYICQSEVKEIKPDKQAIGKTDNPLPFTTHKIKLNKNDMLFLFTDGYADQFGGEKGKKFKYKPLKELLTNNAHLQLTEQKQLLFERFENWRGNLDQVDDVCVIGIKL